MEHTTNYQLSQWSMEDRIQMEDFNSDNAKIDAALTALSQSAAEKTRLAFGSYTGNGAESRFISTGFTPKAVLVMGKNGGLTGSNPTGSDPIFGGLAVVEQSSESSTSIIKIVNGGFNVVYKGSMQSNQKSRYYIYIALG